MDSLRWVLGEDFCEVTCYGSDKGMVPSPGYTDGQDFQVAIFKTRSNAIARISAALSLARGYSIGAAVFGTKGSLEMDRVNFRGGDEDLTMYLTRVEDLAPKKKDVKTRVEPVGFAYDPLLKGKDDPKIGKPNPALFAVFDLVQAIADDRQPEINVYEAARSSAAALCAELSAREHRAVPIPQFHQRMR